MLTAYDKNKENFNVTHRRFESIIRSVKARARCMLKNKVDEDDCATVFELYSEMLKTANSDVCTPSTSVKGFL